MASQSFFIVLTVHARDIQNHDRLPPAQAHPNQVYINIMYNLQSVQRILRIINTYTNVFIGSIDINEIETQF